MLTLVTVVLAVIVPATLLVALLLAVGRTERARDARIARQVAVTDAIHRELGAVVAPVVRRRFGRDWRVEIAVPFESEATVGRVVSLAHAAMVRTGVDRGIEIVLAAQAPDTRHTNVRTLRPVGSSPLAASEWENAAWTSTNTSRAV
jgi:hypothetical protein